MVMEYQENSAVFAHICLAVLQYILLKEPHKPKQTERKPNQIKLNLHNGVQGELKIRSEFS